LAFVGQAIIARDKEEKNHLIEKKHYFSKVISTTRHIHTWYPETPLHHHFSLSPKIKKEQKNNII
jgi:hypothetical protein